MKSTQFFLFEIASPHFEISKNRAKRDFATHRINTRKLLGDVHHEGNEQLLPVHRGADLGESKNTVKLCLKPVTELQCTCIF